MIDSIGRVEGWGKGFVDVRVCSGFVAGSLEVGCWV